LFDWLNANAAAVQALMAIVVGGATVALVAMTARYVRLTRTLVEDAQARAARESTEGVAQAQALAVRLRAAVSDMLERMQGSTPQRSFPTIDEWRNAVDSLEEMALMIPGPVASRGQLAAAALRATDARGGPAVVAADKRLRELLASIDAIFPQVLHGEAASSLGVAGRGELRSQEVKRP